ncbi:glycoside hydrolase family 51 protein [Saccharata proteae CBS 121410]|uniref:non-reducing end alpha-L-arabinofuranosidase n=1 Tax=Saccharata proteae CBS 121410 TaxID=1314787 RepID=A0A9P4HZ33_9PEZI|nr:glycoside hydrolase family 51 protein [Saccharata proteae CBS 121410]
MPRSSGFCALSFAAILLWAPALIGAYNITVTESGGNASSSVLYGMMFEDINHSGDGGIHGQLLRNNGFQGDVHNLTAYATVGNVNLSVDSSNPLSTALPYSLSVAVPDGATGDAGFSNEGYWGIPVNTDTYASYFWIKGTYSGEITLRLVGKTSGIEYASKTITVTSNSTFSYWETTFDSEQAPDGDNLWTLTFDASQVAGSSLNFDLVQLFPTTFNQRYNGLKPSVANVVNDIGGSFLRFPGGNNLEGESLDTRWKWNETIGPVHLRPGRQGDWGYPNTDALGLVEYLYWCQDMALEPLLAIWSGFSLDGSAVTGDALTPYVDDVLNELEFIMGDASTTYGALRASLGYSSPFEVHYVEIGNEDYLSGGCDTYAERFTAFYDAISAAYPNLTIVASTNEADCLPSPIPAGVWQDYHNYNSPEGFVSLFNQFDNANRSQPLIVGEYARRGVDIPDMLGAVSEAVYMIGMERNSDVIKMASYAPLLQLWNDTQWVPDLIGFNQNPNGVVKSTSYYAQQMFAKPRDTIKETTSDQGFGPVYWVASADSDDYYVKMANYGNSSQDVTVTIAGKTTATLTTLSGDEDAYNSDVDPDAVVPVTDSVTTNDGTFSISLPAWSVAVLAAQ